MAQASAPKPAAGPRQTGCYKCGRTGHWARDCHGVQAPGTAQEALQATAIADAQVGLGSAPPNTDAGPQVPAAAAAKKKRRKLTLDLLKQTAGIPDVFHTFPGAFKRQYRGKGHEAGDLRRLLELYMRWQERVYPGVAFDRFIADLEQLSGTAVVKHELQEMRTSLLQLAKDKLPRPATEDTAVEPEEDDLAIPDEDEELLGLLAVPPAPASTTPGDDLAIPDEDEELLGLLAVPPAPVSTAPGDDLAIPDEDEEVAMGLLEPGDEDLLLLADEELMGLGN